MTRRLHLILALTLTVSGGCGKSGPKRLPVFPVKGAMAFETRPTAGAMIVFHPLSGDAADTELRPSAVVQNDGTFAPTTYNHSDGLPAGEYALTIYWPTAAGKGEEDGASANGLPSKYDRPETSGLKLTVERRSNNLEPIDLSR